MSPRPFRLRGADASTASTPVKSTKSFRRRDLFAGARILLALFALTMTLASSWPYMYVKRTPEDPLRGDEAWMNTRRMSLTEFTEGHPREPAWLLMPVLVIGLAVWERYEARVRRVEQLAPSRGGAIARLLLFLVLASAIVLWAFHVDLTNQWSPGPSKQLLHMCGWLGLVAVLMDMVAANRAWAAASATEGGR